MEIRPARRGDAERIAAVARETWHAAYGDVLSADAIDATVDEWYAPASLRAAIDRETGSFVVAEADGETADEVVGYLQADYRESVGNVVVSRVYVLPDYWGEGVGTAMLERVATEFHEAGYERVSAVVLADNELGRVFYDARTFEEVGRQTTTLGGEEYDELIVAADLAELADTHERAG